MAEQAFVWKQKKNVKKAAKNLKKALYPKEDEPAEPRDGTVDWFLNMQGGFSVLTPTYNQWADDVFWKKYNLHFCLLDSNFVIKNYSKNYTRLTKYNPAWVGMYPSVYTVQETADEEGNKKDVPIDDKQQLLNVRNLKPGTKFYFAGIMYMVTKVDLKGADDTWGWQMLAQDTKVTHEAIYIRKTLDAYVIINFGLNTNKEGRQNYGSAGNVALILSTFVKKELLNEENEAIATNYLKELDNATNESW